jgi:hypothetical protein
MPEAFGVKSRKNYRETTLKKFPYVVVYKLYIKRKIIFISSITHKSRHPENRYRKG